MADSKYMPEIGQHPLTLILDKIPALESYVEKPRWSARDASRMTELMTKYWKSELAPIAHGFSLLASKGTASDDKRDQEQIKKDIQPFVDGWSGRDFMTILADDGFADMMLAASISAPNAPLFSDELISPHGALYFENRQDLTRLPYGPSNTRAVIWTTFTGDDRDRYMIVMVASVMTEEAKDGWKQVHPRHFYPRLSPYLDNRFFTVNRIDDSMVSANPETIAAFGLVRSISAILASEQTREHTVTQPVTKKAKKTAKRTGKPARDSQVRVVSLVNHDHGRYQLDAVTGHKMRAHWVRGHWRKQWYPATEEHRTIWIDGFVKGDAKLGRVNSAKVHTARTSRP